MSQAKKVEDMSVKDLKQELAAYGVDYVAAGVVEKKVSQHHRCVFLKC